jgi:hypothetical protein
VSKEELEMVEAVKTYSSVGEIAEALDKEIADTKSSLGEYLRSLDEIRTRAERSRRIREVVMKLTGKKNGSSESSDEIEVGSLKIVLDANAFHQLTIIESAVRSHQERLLVLQKAREALKPLDQLSDTEGLDFIVLENQGVPERILLKTS